MRFANREEAGKLLATALEPYRGEDVVVYALPRGGVVLGTEVAKALQAPLDLVIARKIGHPFNAEYAICAISESGRLVCNEQERAAIEPGWFDHAIEQARQEAARRRKRYLDDRPPIPAEGKTAIIVDDGIATGLTMFAAIEELKTQHPRRIIAAIPIIPPETVKLLEQKVDVVVALNIPSVFLGAVGAYYADFPQVSDEEVIHLLRQDPTYIFAFSPFAPMAAALLQLPETQSGQFTVERFPNGELHINMSAPVVYNPCLVIGSITPPDEHLLAMLLLCHTLAKDGAMKITAVLPYLAYTRQDKNKSGQSQATTWVGTICQASGINEIITVDIHSQEAIADFPVPVISLSPAELFADEIVKNEWRQVTLVAPDEGAIARCEAVRTHAEMSQPLAYFHKQRTPEGIQVALTGEIGTNAIIIDDMLDTGSTLVACCEALQRAGATAITVMVTHGLFTGTAWQRLWSLGVQRIYCTDTLPLPIDISTLPISVLSVHPLLKQYISSHAL